jgi:hypothetical protein
MSIYWFTARYLVFILQYILCIRLAVCGYSIFVQLIVLSILWNIFQLSTYLPALAMHCNMFYSFTINSRDTSNSGRNFGGCTPSKPNARTHLSIK